jgi:hypothetical protein
MTDGPIPDRRELVALHEEPPPPFGGTVALALVFAFSGGTLFGAIFGVALAGPIGVFGAAIGFEFAIVLGPLFALGGWVLTRQVRRGRISPKRYRGDFRALGAVLAIVPPAIWSPILLGDGFGYDTWALIVVVAMLTTGAVYGGFAGDRLAKRELQRQTSLAS